MFYEDGSDAGLLSSQTRAALTSPPVFLMARTQRLRSKPMLAMVSVACSTYTREESSEKLGTSGVVHMLIDAGVDSAAFARRTASTSNLPHDVRLLSQASLTRSNGRVA
jgi:hypothetical protein